MIDCPPLYTTLAYPAPEGVEYDEAAAEHAVAFIEGLRHGGGEFDGAPFKLLEWERHLTRLIFGTYLDGQRLYRSVAVFTPSGAGKTEWAAAIIAYVFFLGIRGGELLGLAKDSVQASRVFRRLKLMIEHDPVLRQQVTFYKRPSMVEHLESGATFQVLSKDVEQQWGSNPSLVYIDEGHVIERERYDVVTTMAAKQRDCLLLMTSTAGMGEVSRHSPAYETYDLIRRVSQGEPLGDPTFLGVVYAAPDDAPWDEETSWRSANPSLGHTLDVEVIRAEAERAKQTPSKIPVFRAMRLNQWTEDRAEGLLDMAAWDRGQSEWDPVELEGRRCWAGLDLAERIDFSAFVLVFPWDEGVRVLAHFWTPSEGLREKAERDRMPYVLWRDQGWLETVPGPRIDLRWIKRRVLEFRQRYDIADISYDSWHASQLVSELEDEGLTCVDLRERFSAMSEPTKELAAMVLDGKVDARGNPILRNHAANAIAKRDDAGNIRPARPKVSGVHIDGVSALVRALDGWMRRGRQGPGWSYQAEGGLIVV